MCIRDSELAGYMENMLNGIGGSTTPEEPTLPSDGSYSEEKGVNTPKLVEVMTPIKWNGSSWEETTGDEMCIRDRCKKRR